MFPIVAMLMTAACRRSLFAVPSFGALAIILATTASCGRAGPTPADRPSSSASVPAPAAQARADGDVAKNERPPEPEGSFVSVRGHRFWYRTVGKGVPLVLVPGGPGMSHRYLYPAFDRLADAAQVVYFDAFGRGRSERAKSASEYTFAGDVEDVEALRKALDLDRIAIYGHSYGGLVAQAYALRYPQSVAKVILADTLYGAEMWQKGNDDETNNQIRNQYPEIWAQLMELRSKGAVTCDPEYQKVSGLVPVGLFYFYEPSRTLDFDSNNDVYCRIAGPDADVVLGGDLASIDFRRQLKDIKAPALILTGRFDRVAIPRYAFEFRTFMPQADFTLFEKSGHFPFLEEPDRHDAVVRTFLKK